MGKVIHIDNSGGTGTGYIGVFANYTALLTAYPTAPLLSLAYVQNSQGTAWLPGSLGGTFYSKGTYLFDGVNWVDGLDEVSDELQDLIDDQYKLKVTTNDTTPNYLNDKTEDSLDLFKAISNPSANEKLNFGLFAYNKVWTTAANPTSGDDNSIPKRHRIGQIWFATTSGKFFIAKSILTGVAVWLPIPINESLKTKSGVALAVAFSGTPKKKALIIFATPFTDDNYSVVVTAQTQSNVSFILSVESILAGSFIINANTNNIANLIDVKWVAVKHGEN